MNQVKRIPAYWNRFQYEVLAMIKQLGLIHEITNFHD